MAGATMVMAVDDNDTVREFVSSTVSSNMTFASGTATTQGYHTRTWNGHSVRTATDPVLTNRAPRITFGSSNRPVSSDTPTPCTIVCLYANCPGGVNSFKLTTSLGTCYPQADASGNIQLNNTGSVGRVSILPTTGDSFMTAHTGQYPSTSTNAYSALAGASTLTLDSTGYTMNDHLMNTWANVSENGVAGELVMVLGLAGAVSKANLETILLDPYDAVFVVTPTFNSVLAVTEANATVALTSSFGTLALKILEFIPGLANKTGVDIRVWATATAHANRGAENDVLYNQSIDSLGTVGLYVPGCSAVGKLPGGVGWIECTNSNGLLTDTTSVISSGPVQFKAGP